MVTTASVLTTPKAVTGAAKPPGPARDAKGCRSDPLSSASGASFALLASHSMRFDSPIIAITAANFQTSTGGRPIIGAAMPATAPARSWSLAREVPLPLPETRQVTRRRPVRPRALSPSPLWAPRCRPARCRAARRPGVARRSTRGAPAPNSRGGARPRPTPPAAPCRRSSRDPRGRGGHAARPGTARNLLSRTGPSPAIRPVCSS